MTHSKQQFEKNKQVVSSLQFKLNNVYKPDLFIFSVCLQSQNNF